MKKNHIWGLIALSVLAAAATAMYATLTLAEASLSADALDHIVYIDRDDTADSVKVKSDLGWRWDAYTTVLSYRPRTGRYRVPAGIKCLSLFRMLRNGTQEPLKLVVPSARTMSHLASALSSTLMLDSAEIADALTDPTFCEQYGYTKETIPAMFVPNTYEVYWNCSIEQFMKRMQKEHDAYWTETRIAKAKACGLTPVEVATLASIVDEETANNGEKPMIAGLYLNRLRIGMLLQADPTVKFAMQDFALRRVLNVHLQTESPYNTYRVKGLPPGPIRIPSIAGLEAVLNHAEHEYLYMCAKEDFSGTHNFARNLSEHAANARRYINALNKRGIR